MKYFLDTEFIESGKHYTIDLISIGIISEDGRKYYAISNEFDPKKASDWVKENVLSKLPPKPGTFNPAEASIRKLSESKAWKSREQIKQDLLEFITPDEKGIEFWAGWAAYDWVVFCWIFGCMIDLPDGFPYYCNDVIQWLNQLGLTREFLPPEPKNAHNALDDAQWVKDAYETLEKYKGSVDNQEEKEVDSDLAIVEQFFSELKRVNQEMTALGQVDILVLAVKLSKVYEFYKSWIPLTHEVVGQYYYNMFVNK